MPRSVLFILHLPPPVHGAAMVGKYIHDSELINSRFDCHYINLTTARSLKDIGKGGIRKFGKFMRLLYRIVKTVRKQKPQLVYITPNACGGAFYKDFVVVQLLKALGCRVVAHYHNKGVATRQERRLDDWLYRKFFRNLKVILLAEPLYADVKKYVERKDVFICPNGIPETLEDEPLAARQNAVPHLLFLSNLLESKGVLVLLDALKLLKEQGYSFICDFVGGETAEIDAERFKKEVEMRELNQLVVYDGRKYGAEKEDFFRKADVFVFPTYYHNETFGLVNLEAMEHKLPIVSTDEGGICDVVKHGDNGLIAEKRNPVALADCIGELLNDEYVRQRMGEDGYRKFKENFTLNAFEQRITDCLTDAIGGGKISIACFCGRKYGADKEAFFRKADIFVFPTYYKNECFPLVLLEAMQHGLPCVSTDEGGIRGIIEDGKTGWIVGRQSAGELAERLAWMIKHPKERVAMGLKGRKKFKQKFTLSRFEVRMADILEHLAG